jgi:hypothetical protein
LIKNWREMNSPQENNVSSVTDARFQLHEGMCECLLLYELYIQDQEKEMHDRHYCTLASLLATGAASECESSAL